MRVGRRRFLEAGCLGLAARALAGCGSLPLLGGRRHGPPNIVLVMADDLGYGDTAYNGNKVVRTPNLDAMAKEAVRFDRFYAAAPFGAPTRGSCLTGRHPWRYNMSRGGWGALPPGEATLAEVLKTAGYAAGHVGKWHLGGLSKTLAQGDTEGPADPKRYSPPWENGFDECFSTDGAMPTYNPYYHVGGAYGSPAYRPVQTEPVAKGQRTGGFRWRDHYWTGPGQIADDWLEGDDSRILMDRALDFIRRRAEARTPFLSVIWFHAPHTPVVAGYDDRLPYAGLPIESRHWYGCITAMDREIGRLRQVLRRLEIAGNTIVWFCSDNGPCLVHDRGSAGPLRGRKGTLWEGGIRVPALLEWPGRLPKPRVVNAPVCTSDFYPTLAALAGVRVKEQPPLDGMDVLPILEGTAATRPAPIAFRSPGKDGEGGPSQALVDNRYKLVGFADGDTVRLYDLEADPSETKDVAAAHPDRVKRMRAVLAAWKASCRRSAAGADYR